MLFTVTSKVMVYDKDTQKYSVKGVEAIDYYHYKVYTDKFIEEKSMDQCYDIEDCIIKPYLLNYKGLEVYSGDILEITKGKHVHKYEIHLLDGEVLFRNIDNGIEMGFSTIENKPGIEMKILPYHFNKNRELIELSE